MITQAGTIQDIADAHDQIVLALIAVVATSIAALVWVIKSGRVAKDTLAQATAANAAVNMKAPGEHRLYEMVEQIRGEVRDLSAAQKTFDRRWGNLPPEIDDAVGLVELLHSMDQRITTMHEELTAHVVWEQGVKWPSLQHRHGGGGGGRGEE